MKNYENVSDSELNTMVADLRGGYAGNVHGSESKVKVSDPDSGGLFYMEVDYCNNPSDAWPIVMEYKIDIQHRDGFNTPCAKHCEHMYPDKNPLRAVMVVFLMMQEQKS